MYTFTTQCKFCGEPIEPTDDLLYFIDRSGYVTCKTVYPEYRKVLAHHHTPGD